MERTWVDRAVALTAVPAVLAALREAMDELEAMRAFLNACDPHLRDYAALRVSAAEERLRAEWRAVRAHEQKGVG